MPLLSEEKRYSAAIVRRDALVAPVITVLHALKIRPGFVSLARIVAAIAFILLLPFMPYVATGILAFGLLLDLFDGALARRQGTASDRGKFIDIVTDTVVFFLFLFGTVSTGLILEGTALLIIGTLVASKVFRCIEAARELPTDWRFRAFAGLFPNVIVGTIYVLFLLSLLSMQNYYALLAPLAALALLIDAIISFRKVITKK